MTLSGSCLCGAIRFTARPSGPAAIACHCTQCRKLSGHFSASFDSEAPVMLAGHTAEYATPKGGVRGFCGDCGSSLWFRDADGNWSVEAGTVDGPTGLSLAQHIYCADRGSYYHLDDGLPQARGAA